MECIRRTRTRLAIPFLNVPNVQVAENPAASSLLVTSNDGLNLRDPLRVHGHIGYDQRKYQCSDSGAGDDWTVGGEVENSDVLRGVLNSYLSTRRYLRECNGE